jgi:hypothetical protein
MNIQRKSGSFANSIRSPSSQTQSSAHGNLNFFISHPQSRRNQFRGEIFARMRSGTTLISKRRTEKSPPVEIEDSLLQMRLRRKWRIKNRATTGLILHYLDSSREEIFASRLS